MTLPPARPGLRKARRPPLLTSREVRLVSSSDVRVGELFETADVVSEGASRVDGKQRAYFGSSNIILLIGSEETREGLDRVAQVLARDPHVRLRAMRLARREAAQRANGPLERLEAHITVAPCSRGITVHVDVEATVLPERRRSSRTADGTTEGTADEDAPNATDAPLGSGVF